MFVVHACSYYDLLFSLFLIFQEKSVVNIEYFAHNQLIYE